MADIQSLYKKLKKGYAKNYREYVALRQKLYPKFVFENSLTTIKDEIPVFTLHSVNSQRFEEQLFFLSANGYSTLTADELYECLIGNKHINERTIVLTFDDGWKNLYTVAYPLLKKYKFYGVCFLIAGLIPEPPKISEVKKTNAVSKENSSILDSKTLCNWEEIVEMHQSGVIDFQSHSMYHYLINTSSEIVDFFHPGFESYALNMDIPLTQTKGKENYKRDIPFGTPIYKHDSRFSGKSRYFDDENIRNECVKFVQDNGGVKFFKKASWRKHLYHIVENYRKQNDEKVEVESESELRKNIYNEFRDSKILIEKYLPSKSINHFCFPWWVGSDVATEISKEAGYKSNFWGVLPDTRINKRGDDPYKITRILSDDYIFRLPGEGRKSHSKIIQEKLFQNKNALRKIFK
jgi:hypothetical protein